jgi:ArsR family transcriptional regulator, arsenate/arsenite/antimonite-responsive transcriptional repressor
MIVKTAVKVGEAAAMDDITACCSAGLGTPISHAEAQRLSQVLKAVADPIRLRLLSLILANGEACACELNEPVGLSQPTVSHHLKVLTDAGLINREQRGTWAWFSVNPDRMSDLANLFTRGAGGQS